jgi:hypothetical protein
VTKQATAAGIDGKHPPKSELPIGHHWAKKEAEVIHNSREALLPKVKAAGKLSDRATARNSRDRATNSPVRVYGSLHYIPAKLPEQSPETEQWHAVDYDP